MLAGLVQTRRSKNAITNLTWSYFYLQISTRTIKNIRTMHAVSSNQTEDILHLTIKQSI